MKRSYSDDNLTKLDNKKRKCSSLTIKPVFCLNNVIYVMNISKHYGQCISAFFAAKSVYMCFVFEN